MDRTRFERYLRAFSPAKSPRQKPFLAAARRALDAACLPAGRGGVERSWLESSVAASSPGAARFIHYYRMTGGLGPAGRRKVWLTAFSRFLGLLEELNSAGAAFDLAKAARLRALLAAALPVHSSVLASAEWLPETGECLKATVYAVTQAPLGAAAAGLARLSGDGAAWTGPASAADMDMLGADLHPGGGLEFKVYRRSPLPEAAPEKWYAGLVSKLRRLGADSVTKAYKYDRQAASVRIHRADFCFAGRVRPAVFAAGFPPAAGRAAGLLKARGGAGFAVTHAGMKPAGGDFELYFS